MNVYNTNYVGNTKINESKITNLAFQTTIEEFLFISLEKKSFHSTNRFHLKYLRILSHNLAYRIQSRLDVDILYDN